MANPYRRQLKAYIRELSDKELARVMLQAAAEWRRRRIELEESEEGPAAAVSPGDEIAAPPGDIIEELTLIREKLTAGKVIPLPQRQYVKSVALCYPEWVRQFGLPQNTNPENWVDARVMLQSGRPDNAGE